MENSSGLRKVVYSVLLTQIQFGVYHHREKLPTIEETSARLRVSIDTARAAYLRLKEQGYISLSKNIGATVKVNYGQKQTEGFIQAFFSARKSAMIDLANSMRPLLGNAQWMGVKYASVETMQAMERLSREERAAAPYAMLDHLNQKYAAFENSILLRLVWQTFMFLHNPFFSIQENLRFFDQCADYLPTLLTICHNKDWPALRATVDQSMERLSLALQRFYACRISTSPPEKEIVFTWSSYKNSQQLCYSFAMEILLSINQGLYPAGSLLPSQKELASKRGVSLSTVRRALELLRSIGAIQSAKYVGTRVLPFDKATENSDFTNPVLRQRLLDMLESLQILALSCKEVSLLALSSLDPDSIRKLCHELKAQKQAQCGEALSYFLLDSIAKSAPYQAIRTVYSELLRQFFWAYALRGMQGSRQRINALYDPYFDAFIGSLEKADLPGFCAKLEALVVDELHRTANALSHLGMMDAQSELLIPEK